MPANKKAAAAAPVATTDAAARRTANAAKRQSAKCAAALGELEGFLVSLSGLTSEQVERRDAAVLKIREI